MARRRVSRRQRNVSADGRVAALCRRLRFEPLEDRRLLSVYQVTTNGDTSGLTPIGGTGIVEDPFQIATLRSAIEQANAAAGADTITFDADLSGETISLSGTELEITETLVIDARPLAANVTIDAQQSSRIINVTATTVDFTLGGLTLTGGRTTGSGTSIEDSTFGGGAIRSLATGDLHLDRVTVSGNSTTGDFAWGGGIFAENSLTLNQSTVSGNSTAGVGALGGGIAAGRSRSASATVILNQSTVSENSTAGNVARGGGVYVRVPVSLIQSTISGNSTTAADAAGGGLFAEESVTLTESTVSGNSTEGDFGASGGGIWAFRDVLLTTDSTVTGNSTAGAGARGGGIYAFLSVTLIDSTISGNSTSGMNAGGGGIYAHNGGVMLTRSIISGNSTVGNSAHGGGIYALQTVSLTESTVSGNNTEGVDARGGGIVAVGNMTLTQSIVSGNSTAGDYGHGGGIYAFQTVTLTQSAVSENWTTGTLAAIGGIRALNVALTGSTVSDNYTTGMGSEVGGIGALTVALTDSAVWGNHTAGPNAVGGGILATQSVSLTNSTVCDNYTTGSSATGGGIIATGDVTLTRSTVRGNYTTGQSAHGGGIYVDGGDVSLSESILSGNYTRADFAFGGGIYTNLGAVTLDRSTVSGNHTEGTASYGGGIRAVLGDLTLTHSTVSGNYTLGTRADGGGVWASGDVTLTRSTLSGNYTAGSTGLGGGILTFSRSAMTITQSTLTDNRATGMGADGGAIFVRNLLQNLPLAITGSIVAGNTTVGGGSEVVPDPDSQLIINHSLIGMGISPTSGGNNVVTDDPQLGPLADNGGPTQTHALLPGSPAIDAGDPIAGSSAPLVWYRFEETAGTSAADAVGGHNGTFENGVSLGQSGPPKLVGSAVEFDGIDDYISVANSFSTSELGGDSYTVELWFNAAAGGKQQSLVALTDGEPSPGHAVLVEINADNTIRFLNRIPPGISGGDNLSSTQAIDPGSWYHLAVVRDGAIMRIYLDGLEVAMLSGATGDLPDAMVLTFGRLAESLSARYFDGRMDDVAIYNHALSDDEIALHSAAGIPTSDQRGMPYQRVADGDVVETIVIDIGAYEAQGIPEALPGDYNRDGVADAADYTVWRDALGSSGLTPLTGADGDGNGAVDETDYVVWRSHFGVEFALQGAGSGAPAAADVEQPPPIVASVVDETANDAAPTMRPIAADSFVTSGPRAEARAHLPTRSAATAEHRLAPSSQAVDLLLAVTKRTAPHDYSTVSRGEFSLHAIDHDANDHDRSLAAIDVALAGLDVHL